MYRNRIHNSLIILFCTNETVYVREYRVLIYLLRCILLHIDGDRNKNVMWHLFFDNDQASSQKNQQFPWTWNETDELEHGSWGSCVRGSVLMCSGMFPALFHCITHRTTSPGTCSADTSVLSKYTPREQIIKHLLNSRNPHNYNNSSLHCFIDTKKSFPKHHHTFNVLLKNNNLI